LNSIPRIYALTKAIETKEEKVKEKERVKKEVADVMMPVHYTL